MRCSLYLTSIFSLLLSSNILKSVNSLVNLQINRQLTSSRISPLYAKTRNQSGKGFGKPIKDIESTSDGSKLTDKQLASSTSTSSSINSDIESTNNGNVDDMIQNTDMFKKKRQFQQESLDEKIQRLRDEEELLASDPSVGAVPELVANRMLGRIIVFFGIPVFGGLAIFVTAFFASKYYDLTIPPVVIAYATQLPFVLGLAGISYAILSSSWDEEDGSKLGISEFKTNLKRIQDGFDRTKSNEILKDDIEKEGNRLQNRRK